MRILPDLTADELDPAGSAMLILPGAGSWHAPGGNAVFAEAARRFLDAGTPVAAICGATFGLARAGLLDDREHTSGAAGYLAGTGYAGGAHYREAAAVTDGDLITAGPTAPVEFAREIFARLGVYTPEVLDAWYRLFAKSDASAYPVLMAASR
jgi:putative intracellular protease/amidase